MTLPKCPVCGTTTWMFVEEENIHTEYVLTEQGSLEEDTRNGTGEGYVSDWKCMNDHWVGSPSTFFANDDTVYIEDEDDELLIALEAKRGL